MARQTQSAIRGTINNITFYELKGKYYARSKSSLTGKRVKKDPAFKKTMQYAGLMAKASKIASALYQLLPAKKKRREVYQALTGRAMNLLMQGITADDAMEKLRKEEKV